MPDHVRMAHHSLAGRRTCQEDSVLVDTLPDGRTLVAVADGMGGHAAGEVASALAITTLVDALSNGARLGEAFHQANASVHLRSQEPDKQGMGTTMVAMLLDGDGYEVANVGDSRGYLMDSTGIRRITADHSFVAEAVRRGQSEMEALSSHWRDALTRSIGTGPEVDVDVYGPFRARDGTAVLLCSDGLHKVLPDTEVRRVYGQSGGPRAAVRSLVHAAYEAGSNDNITVAVAEFGQMERRPLEATSESLDGVVKGRAGTGAPTLTPVNGASPKDEGGARRPWWKVWTKERR